MEASQGFCWAFSMLWQQVLAFKGVEGGLGKKWWIYGKLAKPKELLSRKIWRKQINLNCHATVGICMCAYINTCMFSVCHSKRAGGGKTHEMHLILNVCLYKATRCQGFIYWGSFHWHHQCFLSFKITCFVSIHSYPDLPKMTKLILWLMSQLFSPETWNKTNSLFPSNLLF